jgi:hypothetical protein
VRDEEYSLICIPAEAAFPSARAENLCASASIDLVSRINRDFTPPFCTSLSSSSSVFVCLFDCLLCVVCVCVVCVLCVCVCVVCMCVCCVLCVCVYVCVVCVCCVCVCMCVCGCVKWTEKETGDTGYRRHRRHRRHRKHRSAVSDVRCQMSDDAIRTSNRAS